MSAPRSLSRTLTAQPVSDGAGVRLARSLGYGDKDRLDPFLMLDEFNTDEPKDYIAGFPAHPHRGFETVTYMLEGAMLHEDHLGNRGRLGPGGVQWMTAARGIIHSEMPQQQDGRMHGFQLWINLPAAEKMKPASYRDIPAADVPEIEADGGVRVRVIAGGLDAGVNRVAGPVSGISTQPLFLDVRLPAGSRTSLPVPAGHNAFAYVYRGALSVGDPPDRRSGLQRGQAGLLGDGDRLDVVTEDGADFLLLAARPIGEPVVQYGPFVMTTRADIEQALRDYRDGVLTG